MTITYEPVAQSLTALFSQRVQELGDGEAFRAPTPEGGWESLSWRQTEQRTHELAAGLLSLGLEAEQRVGLLSTTRLEWVLADLAILMAGGATTAVYPNTMLRDVAYILGDSACVAAFAENSEQLAKLRAARDDLPQLRTVIVMDAEPGLRDDPANSDGWVISMTQLAERGREYLAHRPDAVTETIEATTLDRLATLIYTSGTTGNPKGVELTHGNWVYLGYAADHDHIARRHQLHLLWLPLSHVFGKLLLAAQYQIGFRTVIDGRMEKIADNLAEVQPQLMVGAPRVFEKMYGRVSTMMAEEKPAKRRIYDWAVRVGTACVEREQAKRRVPYRLAAQRKIADRLVFSKIRARLGGQMETLVSGSAALSPDIARWFAVIGLPISEGYGMTEGCGGLVVNPPGQVRIGSVGKPLMLNEVRIADDGEIMLRSRSIMRGYHKQPELTRQVLDPDGWFATGDVGYLDEDGYLFITDRKRDLVKTSGGKYIAPSLIENSIMAVDPMIAQVVVIAAGKNFPSALVALETEAAAQWAADRQVAVADLPTHPEILAQVQRAVDNVNATLNHWEQIKQFRILPRELSVEEGELTASFKVKRPVVTQHFADLITDIYTSKPPA